MTDDEKFFAWLDGELGPAEAAEMEAKVAADPEARAARRAASRARRTAAERLRSDRGRAGAGAAAGGAAPVGTSRSISPPPSARAHARRSPQWAAMAATLAIGIFVGTWSRRARDAPVEAQGGKLYAAAARQPARSTPSSPAHRPATFASASPFATKPARSAGPSPAPAASGLACRNGGRWQHARACSPRPKDRQQIIGWPRAWTRTSRRWSDRPWPASRSMPPRESGTRQALALVVRASPERGAGGPSRNRTGVQGFAVLCVTTPPSGLEERRAL